MRPHIYLLKRVMLFHLSHTTSSANVHPDLKAPPLRARASFTHYSCEPWASLLRIPRMEASNDSQHKGHSGPYFYHY